MKTNIAAMLARQIANSNADNPRLLDFRNTLHLAANELDRQAERIWGLEQALASIVGPDGPERRSCQPSACSDEDPCIWCAARRVLKDGQP